MDSREVPVQVLAIAALLLLGGAGCARRPAAKPTSMVDAVKKEVLGKKKDDDDPQPMVMSSKGSDFSVNNAVGKPILKAKSDTMQGTVVSGKGLQGPVKLTKTKALLYEKGEPRMNMETPEAIWHPDVRQLTTDKTAHSVTTDGKTIMDAQKATWKAEGAILELEQGKVQAMKDGKLDFTAEGPKATVVDRWVTMPAGAVAQNPDGQKLTSDHLRWNLDSGELEAHGHVVVTDKGTRILSPSLKANTKLQRGHFTGRTRVTLKDTKQLPGPKKRDAKAGAEKPAKKHR